MKRKPKVIQGKELLKQLAELSGYRLYEIEDVLNNLAICIADNAKLGYSTHLKGIGTINYKQGHNIEGISNLTGEEYNTTSRNTLTLKIDSIMSNALNESIE